jgi:hypothetical protein
MSAESGTGPVKAALAVAWELSVKGVKAANPKASRNAISGARNDEGAQQRIGFGMSVRRLNLGTSGWQTNPAIREP